MTTRREHRRFLRAERRARGEHTARSAVIGILLTAAAVVLTALAPSSWQAEEPFVTTGALGESIDGGLQVIRVDEALRTSTLIADDVRFSGTWLAVHVTAAATRSERSAAFGLSRALVGDTVYHDARFVPDTMYGEPLRVGSGTAGWVVFAFPADIDLTDVRVQFVDDVAIRLRGGVIEVDLTSPEQATSVQITEPELAVAP